jgi:1-pyrroline-5-carboxylate dehydrogenase
MATYSNYLVYQLLAEAGVPPGVIQFVPGPPAEVVAQAITHPNFAALHFTGSTFVFKKLWKDIAMNLDRYKGYPRIVGETGGKNFHLVHQSADVRNAVVQTVRGAFEYQGQSVVLSPGLSRFFPTGLKIIFRLVLCLLGQKCSALSRLYVSSSIWNNGFKDQLLAEVAKIRVGPPSDWSNFMGPVMYASRFSLARSSPFSFVLI